jgi:hypothetical protein
MPAPQPQTRSLVLPPQSLGRSGWFSQKPVSSHTSHFIIRHSSLAWLCLQPLLIGWPDVAPPHPLAPVDRVADLG